MMSGFFAGAEMSTFSAPASRCFKAPSLSLNLPEDSMARYTSRSLQGSLSGSDSYRTFNSFPSTMMASSPTLTLKGGLPWTLSYLRRCARVFASPLFIATKSMSSPLSRAAL